MARLIEPWIARSVARRVAGDAGFERSYLLERLERDLHDAVPRAEALVAAASGIPTPPPVHWRVVDRYAWADANISSMALLLEPLEARIGARLDAAPLPLRAAQRAAVSVEIGALLGYVSRRVLGQYDVLVPEDGAVGGRGAAALSFVGPNVVETERKFGFVPEDFALWVAVHEVTHRFQFAGVGWLRPRFLALVDDYMTSVELDVGGLVSRLAGAAARLARGDAPPEERNPVYLLASDRQRGVLDAIQALMAVVEGHGNYVMDAVGADVIPTFRRMRFVFAQRRRQTSVAQRALNNVLGIEMKLRQYELGQSFCDEIARRRGADAFAALWSDESNLPTLAELREPTRWLDRVA
ncbi:MAG TPA: zinc-dependent metalloprotease [Actinomycetota bacterium]|nr:zinc-dependent metalloprotease [Actinomycetota bacterium]